MGEGDNPYKGDIRKCCAERIPFEHGHMFLRTCSLKEIYALCMQAWLRVFVGLIMLFLFL